MKSKTTLADAGLKKKIAQETNKSKFESGNESYLDLFSEFP